MRKKVVWLDTGWMPVWVGFCPSVEVWKRENKRLTGNVETYDGATACGCTRLLRDDKGKSVILVMLGQSLPEDDPMEVMMTLVHEGVHVWQFIRQVIGEDAPGIEMEAYSIECIARELVSAYCKSQGKGKVWA